MKRLRWKPATAGLVLIGATVAAAPAIKHLHATPDAPPIETVRVTRRTIATEVKATGVVRPMTGAQVRVGPRISGIVKMLAVRVGDRVSRGQLLAELDDRELVARRDEAVAALNLAQANLAFAAADLARKRALADGGLLARNDLDLAQRAADVAQQEVGQALASVDYAATQLTYARVNAPIDGVVASVSTQEGETVAASFATPTFVTLLDLNRLEVWTYVDETDIGRVRVGQAATFTVDTYAGDAFTGRVSEIYPQADVRDNVVDYVTVLRFTPVRQRPLRPEMTATVRIAIEARPDALALPLKVVRRRDQQTFVWRRRAGTVVRVPVALGIRDNAFWEIRSGVEEGDEVLVGDPQQQRSDS
jgi:RND family efflux transporter MFP subunit